MAGLHIDSGTHLGLGGETPTRAPELLGGSTYVSRIPEAASGNYWGRRLDEPTPDQTI
jgi:hypothetical protein